ncbi:hypothetical protein VTL71DRAFT_16009 [Oculimacula yallundae]|uniref:Uncharacterized protein n=1 Tax=Oculimacula yallundae TaxID=86028 RepID=A0ABR4CEL8_9HELO
MLLLEKSSGGAEMNTWQGCGKATSSIIYPGSPTYTCPVLHINGHFRIECQLDGRVSYNYTYANLARVLDVRTVLASEDPFGPYCGGTLKLACTAFVSKPFNERRQAREPSTDWDRKVISTQLDCGDEVVEATFLLPLGEAMNNVIHGVIVEQIAAIKGEFRKIAAFHAFTRLWPGYAFEERMDAIGSATVALDCAKELHDPESRKQRYVIAIV